MGSRRTRNGRPVRLSVSECAARLSVDIFREAFLKANRTEIVAFDVIWTGRDVAFNSVDPTLPPTKELLENRGYVGQVTLVSDQCSMYTRAPRWYFSCGGCGHRRSRIYAARAGSEFLCGPCLNITYPSAQRWNNLKRTGWRAGERGRDSKYGGGATRRFWKALVAASEQEQVSKAT